MGESSSSARNALDPIGSVSDRFVCVVSRLSSEQVLFHNLVLL